MTDRDYEHDGYVFNVLEDELIEVPEEEPHVEEAAEEPAKELEKPEFGLPKRGLFAKKGDIYATQTSGPQVAYVNQRLGLSGDEYTEQTVNAVRKFQADNGLYPNGRVDMRTYARL